MRRARSFEAAHGVPRAFDGGRLGRMTSLGLGVATLGWIALVAVVALSDRIASRDIAAAPGRLHADMLALAECLIGSGFALAAIGTLRTGFGALDRFFNAALDRSASRVAAAASATATAEPRTDATDVAPSSKRQPYIILADGSVEVETILGTRRFGSMAEARDFL